MTRTGSPTSLLRRSLGRALWPYLEDRQRVDTAVLDAVTSLHRSIQALEQRVLQLEDSGRQGGRER